MTRKQHRTDTGSNRICVRILQKKKQTLLCQNPFGKRKPLVVRLPREKNGSGLRVGGCTWIAPKGDGWVAANPAWPEIADIESRLRAEYDVPEHFPRAINACMEEAKRAPDRLAREDLRGRLFITMDGEDARDFDDAISVRDTGKGWEILVAIADVTHYVSFSGKKSRASHVSIDNEARARGNTFYFPTSMTPMLPRELATDLASLMPNAERRVLVCEMHVARSGLPLDYRFYPALIASRARLSYEGFEAAFLRDDPEARAAFLSMPDGKAIAELLHDGLAAAEALRSVRRKKGSLIIQSGETLYEIRNGKLAGLRYRKPHAGHNLIEECMLAANEACALFLSEKDIPFPSRIHPEPDPGKLAELRALLFRSIPEILPNRPLAPGDIADLLERTKGTDREDFVAQTCLRALPRARYSPVASGHFGLAKEAYCHFTSPIRRYADILVHRALKLALGVAADPVVACRRLSHICEHINGQEERAERIERAMNKKLACLALARNPGESHPACVSCEHERGLFVRLSDIPASGLIPRGTYHEGLGPGDMVRVRLHAINTQKDYLTFLPEN